VVIAHRLSRIVKAEQIYVIDGGRVVESGNYDDLMAKAGAFAALVKRQLA
jgi:ABC-type multidrug transport system fused ATPase/permease subunit